MERLPYPHRVIIRKYIITPEFSLGVGCTVVLDLAAQQLVKLLRIVFHKDRTALELNDAALNYLLHENGNPRKNTGIPCLSVPIPICYQPKIISPKVINGK